MQVTVAVLVGALTISTWYFAHSYPKTAVTSLSESLRLEILVNTSELLDVILKMNTYSAAALLNLMEKKFFGNDFGVDSIEQVLSTFLYHDLNLTLIILQFVSLDPVTYLCRTS